MRKMIPKPRKKTGKVHQIESGVFFFEDKELFHYEVLSA